MAPEMHHPRICTGGGVEGHPLCGHKLSTRERHQRSQAEAPSGQRWREKYDKVMKECGAEPSRLDPCVYLVYEYVSGTEAKPRTESGLMKFAEEKNPAEDPNQAALSLMFGLKTNTNLYQRLMYQV